MNPCEYRCECKIQTIYIDGWPVHYFGGPPDELTEETREGLTAKIRSMRLEAMRRDHGQPLQ